MRDKSNSFKRKPISLMVARLAAASALVSGAGALAQERSHATLEEVIVTVQRTEATLSVTPVSALAMTGETMDDLGVKSVENLVAFVPGLKLDGNDPSEMRMSLRGAFTSADTPSTEQSVGFFIDGVYLGHTGDLTTDFFDIERVEVLRGPQGTLWGRNVVGGAINVVTKNPSQEFEAEGAVTVGNYERLEFGGRISGPINGDNVLGQFAFKTRKADGHTEIVDILNQGLKDAGKKLGGEDVASFRSKLQINPSDDGEIILSLDYFNDNTEGPAPRNIVAGGVTRLYPLPKDRFDTWQKIAGDLDREIWGVSMHVNWDFPIGTLSSITAYRHMDAFFNEFSFDAAPVGAINLERDFGDELFSQELRLAGSTDSIDWQGGVYYYYNDAERTEFYREDVDPRTVAALFGFNETPGDSQAWRKDTGETQSWALFGQATWHINNWLNLTLGGRYSYDKKESDPEAFSPVNPLDPVINDPTLPAVNAGFKTHVSDNWSAFTPKITVDTFFEDVGPFESLMSYVTYSEGFKSGGFETRTTLEGSKLAFDPEESKSFEVGVKTRFWDSRAMFNLAAFRAEYTDMQGLEQPRGQVGFVVFTSDATVDGIEAEFQVVPFTGLQLNLAYAYTDGTYDSGSTTSTGDISGNRLPQTPTNSWTIGANYNLPLTGDNELNFNVNYGRKSGVFFNPDNKLAKYVDPVTGDSIFDMTKQAILDAQIAYRFGDWEIAAWGKNLLDEEYLMRAQDPFRFWGLTPADYFSGMNLVTGTWGAPRTYGLTVSWRNL